MGVNRSVIVVAETSQGRPVQSAYELITLAGRIAEAESLEVRSIVLSEDPGPAARDLAAYSGAPVLAAANKHLTGYNGELFRQILAELLPPFHPVYVLCGHTTSGLDLAPGLAARLGGDCITGVSGLSARNGKTAFIREIFGGKIAAEVVSRTEVTVVTVQPGAFRAEEPRSNPAEDIQWLDTAAEPRHIRLKEESVPAGGGANLKQAEVIVAAGRGVGKPENMTLIDKLASFFPRSAVAGSRPVCDNGWLDYQRQVGLTGTTVAPKLYIACGISGARQHTVGMQGSGFITAISTDPNAVIFRLSDVAVVEDLTAFIPILIEEMEKDRNPE